MDYKDLNDYELVYEVRESNELAYNILINKYSTLINKMASDYYKKAKSYKVEYYVGLFQALDYYEEKTCLFYTYAIICIKREMERLIKSFSRKKNMILNDAISMNKPLDKYNELFIEDILASKEKIEEDIYLDIKCKNIMDLKYDMPMDMAAVYELKYNKFNIREISILLDLPKKRVEKLINRSRKMVKSYLKTID